MFALAVFHAVTFGVPVGLHLFNYKFTFHYYYYYYFSFAFYQLIFCFFISISISFFLSLNNVDIYSAHLLFNRFFAHFCTLSLSTTPMTKVYGVIIFLNYHNFSPQPHDIHDPHCPNLRRRMSRWLSGLRFSLLSGAWRSVCVHAGRKGWHAYGIVRLNFLCTCIFSPYPGKYLCLTA